MQQHLHARWRVTALACVALAAAILAPAGCTHRTPPPPVPSTTSPNTTWTPGADASPTPTRTPQAVIVVPGVRGLVSVYFVRGEHLGAGTQRLAPAKSPARTAVEALLGGVNSSERKLGLTTAIPDGTRLLGLSIEKGTATVDLSEEFESGGGTLSMTLRIAQVVNTLTQFKSVKRVAFRIDGKKVEYIGGEGIIVAPSVDRADFESALPAIMLEEPAPHATVHAPVRIRGSANVFEAHFMVRITDAAGKVVAEKPVKATSGTGTRGTFDVDIAYKATTYGTGSITVYEPSAKDGSETNVVTIPVRLERTLAH